jgi:hypothetical protein
VFATHRFPDKAHARRRLQVESKLLTHLRYGVQLWDYFRRCGEIDLCVGILVGVQLVDGVALM